MDNDFVPVREAGHACSAFTCGPLFPLVLFLAFALGAVLAWAFFATSRERRLAEIWSNTQDAVKKVEKSGEANAAVSMAYLIGKIREELGALIVEGHIAAKVKVLHDALNTVPKPPVGAPGSPNPTFSATVTDHRLVNHGTGAAAPAPATSGLPADSPNAKAWKAFVEFRDWWKHRGARIENLRELQHKLTVGR